MSDDLTRQIDDLRRLLDAAAAGHEEAGAMVRRAHQYLSNEGPEALLTQAQLAERLGVTTRTIRNLDLPEIRVGNRPRYRLAECLESLKK